jgi:subtilisin-like proprotein convertase family protein
MRGPRYLIFASFLCGLIASMADIQEVLLVSPIPPQRMEAGSSGQVRPRIEAFTSATPVILTASSSNTNSLRDGDITIEPALGGPGERTVRFTTQPGATDAVVVTLTAAMGHHRAVRSFLVELGHAYFRSANGRLILIPDNAHSTPYPSVIDIGSGHGLLSEVRVRLNGFAHQHPRDVDILLQAPDGHAVLLMSDAGGESAVVDRTIVLSSRATNEISVDQLSSGVYAPTDYDQDADLFAAPAPNGPIENSFASLLGAVPDGTWKLYAIDDSPSDTGEIAGWTIEIAMRDLQLTTDPLAPFGLPLIVFGPPHLPVTLQSSPDLRAWSNTLSTNLDWNGAARILEKPSDPRRYYRVVK